MTLNLPKIVLPEEYLPLSLKDTRFYPKRFVGDCGENLAEFLLNTSGYICLKFGMENHIMSLKKELGNNYQHETNNKLRYMPDIIAIKDKKAHLIEVKWKKSIQQGKKILFGYKQIDNYRKYWNDAYILIICPEEPYFLIMAVKDIKDNMCGGFYPDSKCEEEWNFSEILKPFQKEFKIKNDAINMAIPIVNRIKSIFV